MSRYNEYLVATFLKPRLMPPPFPKFVLGIMTLTFLYLLSKIDFNFSSWEFSITITFMSLSIAFRTLCIILWHFEEVLNHGRLL